jgi:hypothetical protein
MGGDEEMIQRSSDESEKESGSKSSNVAEQLVVPSLKGPNAAARVCVG